MIYPEAHIWPYYIGIRPFPPTSMRYPVDLNAPSFCMTTTYRCRAYGNRPRIVVYVDGPFYPDKTLAPRQRAEALRDRIYATMVKRSAMSDCEYVRYLPKEKALEEKD